MKMKLQRYVGKLGILSFVLLLLSITVKAQPVANFKADKQTGCSPHPVTFTDASTGNIVKRSWKLDGSLTVADSLIVSTTFLAPGIYPVTLTVTDNNGVTASKIMNIQVYAVPKVNYTYSDSIGCVDFSVTFKNLSTPGDGSITHAEWVFGDGVAKDTLGYSVSHTYKTAAKGDVTLSVTNSFGCKSSLSKVKMEALALPKLDIESSLPVTNCTAPFTVTFKNKTLSSEPLTYTWNFGDGDSLLPTTNKQETHIFNKEGSFQVFLIAANARCKDSIKLKYLIEIKKPKAGFTFAKDTVCQGMPVSFKNITNPGPSASTWIFGDGGTSSATNPEHAFSKAGTFSVKLTIKVGDCVDSISKKITVLPSPVCSFTSDGIYGCTQPFATNFKNTSTGGAFYEWDFGDDSTSTEKDPKHVYDSLGAHTVKLKVTNSFGCFCVITKDKYIVVNNPKISKLIITRDEKPPLTFQHSAVITTIDDDPIESYEWDFGDGKPKSTEEKPKHTYDVEGKYPVTLTVKTKNGCIATIKLSSDVNNTSGGGADGGATGPTTVCSSIPIQFNDKSPKADKWLWDFGDGKTSTKQNPSHDYDTTGIFTVTLKVWYQGSFMGVKVFTNYITINSGGIAKFTYARDCSKKMEIKFTNLSTGADNFLWKFGDSTTSTAKNPPPHIYPATGAYKVTLIVKSGLSACVDSSKVTLGIINEKPNFKTTDTAFCKLKVIRHTPIGIDSSRIEFYHWNFGDVPGAIDKKSTREDPPVTYSYNLSGIFDVRLVIKDTVGCFDTLVKKQFIKVGGPVADFKPSSLIGCTPLAVTYKDSSTADPKSPIKKWIWNYGDGSKNDTLTAPPYKHTYTKTATYTTRLTVIDTFGCLHFKDIDIQSVKPKAAFTVSDTAECPGNPIYFTSNSSGSNLKYKWYFGDDSTSTSSKSPIEHIYKKGNNYTVSLVVKDQYGCMDSTSFKTPIRIYQPKAAFNMSDSIYSCPVAIIKFTDQSKNALLYKWYFGDGNQSTKKDPSNAYLQADTFRIKLIITSIGGCRDSVTRKLVVKGPSGIFHIKGKAGCAPLTINLSATTKNTTRYIWDFRDGSKVDTTAPYVSHTYNSTGTYKPVLILYDNAGCSVTLKPDSIIAVEKVTAAFTANPQQLCDSGKVSFTSSLQSVPKVKYHWSFGIAGKTDTAANSSCFYNKKGFYPVTLKATSEKGCVDSTTQIIAAPFLPKTTIGVLSMPCLRDTQRLVAIHETSDSIPIKYRWYYSNLQTDTSKSIAVSYPKVGKHSVTLVIRNRYGCVDTLKKILIIDNAVAAFNASKLIICDSSEVKFKDASSYYTKLRYQWNLGNGKTDTVANPAATYSKGGFYPVTLKVTAPLGCTDSTTQYIKAPFLPQTTMATLTPPCLRDTQRFEAIHTSSTAATDTIPLNYLWDFGNGKQHTKKTAALRYDKTGTYSVVLHVNNHYGCADTLRKTITIDDAVAAFNANKVTLCDSGEVKFTDASSYYTKLRYQWDLGNGKKDTATNPAAIYAKSGFYTVTLKVISALGCKDSLTKKNTIRAPFLPATAVNLIAPPCLRDTQRFEALHVQTAATDTIPISYLWHFGNGKQGTKKTEAPRYDSAGKYTVLLAYANRYGCADTIRKTITIDDAVAAFNASNVILCDSGEVKFTNLSTHYTNANYLWDFGDGKTDTLTHPSYTYKKKGIYTVKLKVSSALGCTDSSSKPALIKVSLLPKITLASNAAACLKNKLDFEAKTSFGDSTLTYFWDFDNGHTSTNSQHSEVFTKTGIYHVKLIVTNDYNCTDTLIKPITIHPNPIASVTPKDTTLCTSTQLKLQASGGVKYLWTPALDLACDTCEITTASPSVPRTYMAKVINQYNCFSTDSVRIALKQSPKVLVNNEGHICIGESYQLYATGAQTITWTPAQTLTDPNSFNPVATPSTTTTYQAVGSNKNGCIADTGKVKVVVHELPALDAGGNLLVFNGDSVKLIAKGSKDIITWDWQPAEGLSCNNCPSPSIYLTENKKFTVTAVSKYGCISTDEVQVTMLCRGNMVYIPNAFTPNNDGRNDLFYIKGKGIKIAKSLRIYNRWGALVFERSNFNVDDPAQGWDGRSNGEELPNATFVYLLEMECENGQPVELQGIVTLIR